MELDRLLLENKLLLRSTSRAPQTEKTVEQGTAKMVEKKFILVGDK